MTFGSGRKFKKTRFPIPIPIPIGIGFLSQIQFLDLEIQIYTRSRNWSVRRRTRNTGWGWRTNVSNTVYFTCAFCDFSTNACYRFRRLICHIMIIILQTPVDVVSIFLAAAAVNLLRPEKILLQYAVKGHNNKCRYVYYKMKKTIL